MTNRDLAVVLVIVLGVVLLVPLLGASFCGWGMMGPGGMMGRGMMGGYGWGGVGLLPLVALILLVAGIVLVARGVIGRAAPDDEPLQILRQRLARGEITPQQYEELKKALSQ
ncbi:MAG: SHOCT domain-containing protein [Armatimonadota bacterium]|nr:SHOCT domain-containing protein [Armatimonadota bacterium]MDR7451443.1 SHOCT domain-containing protein [Armatimonadota bacterium]MDR7466407.1 SHOCT domain-containing protein [Armatimonadota bacterium]MDR7493129.1 SHOCT domain-containing protein [Armatimonadota bacterium]MDR7498114.1 SHOCT domain-containing protein [Armatimonadota bacterium]